MSFVIDRRVMIERRMVLLVSVATLCMFSVNEAPLHSVGLFESTCRPLETSRLRWSESGTLGKQFQHFTVHSFYTVSMCNEV